MSKKKKKTNNYRERKQHQDKEGWILCSIFVIVGLLSFAYEKVFETITLNMYKPYFFVSYKSEAFDVLMIILLAIIIFSSGIYLFGKTKTSKDKYILRSFAIALVFFIGIIIFHCNVWTFNKDTFSYNTIFQKDKIVYSYDDIDSAEVDVYTYAGRGIHNHIDYTLHMNDGKIIKFNANRAYYTDEDKIIEFDKAIANKRSVVEEDYDQNLKKEPCKTALFYMY